MGFAGYLEDINEGRCCGFSGSSWTGSTWQRGSVYPSPFAGINQHKIVERHSFSSVQKNQKPERQIDLDDIVECNSIILLSINQLNALKEFRQIRAPRSYAFDYWMDYIASNLNKRIEDVTDHLLDLLSSPRSSSVFEKQDAESITENMLVDYAETKASLLCYLIERIIVKELAPQRADRSELINLIDDAAVYISSIERAAQGKPKNSVFVDYVIDKFNPSTRDDHCCRKCGGDLFEGIPYCLICNLPTAR